MTNLIKKAALTTLSVACLCFSLSAQADFRKALDAYIARDGETMLKEVKRAVDTKNCDGLMLFISAIGLDKVQSAKLRMVAEKRPNIANKKLTVIEGILEEKEIDLLFQLLDQVVDKSNNTIKYQFESVKVLFNQENKYSSQKYIQRIKKLSEQKYPPAALEAYFYEHLSNALKKRFYKRPEELKLLEHAADSGSMHAKVLLAFQLLNIEYSGVDNFEQYGPKRNDGLGCKELSEVAKEALPWEIDFREYLYIYKQMVIDQRCQMSDSEMRYLSSLEALIDGENDSLPVDKLISTRFDNEILFSLRRTRGSSSESIYFDAPYFIDVYRDGKVSVLLGSGRNELKVISEVSSLTGEDLDSLKKLLKRLEFMSWPKYYKSQPERYALNSYFTYHFVFNDKSNVYYKQFLSPSNWKENSSSLEGKVADLLVRLEKLVPTQDLRCRLSASESYVHDCLRHEAEILKSIN